MSDLTLNEAKSIARLAAFDFVCGKIDAEKFIADTATAFENIKRRENEASRLADWIIRSTNIM
jgi:hypothetical protein